MFRYKHIYKIILDDIKPELCQKFLILNELSILPREVNWVIIEYTIDINTDIINYKKDQNVLFFYNIYILLLCSYINKTAINFEMYVDSDILMVINQLIDCVLTKNNGFGNDFVIPFIKPTDELYYFIELQSKTYGFIIDSLRNTSLTKDGLINHLQSQKKYIDLIY